MRKCYQRIIYLIVVFFIITNLNFAQENISVNYEVVGNQVIIYYQLDADKNIYYDVSLQVRRATAPGFFYKPKDITGDYGKGKFAGDKRTIKWNLTQNELKNLSYDDFYFEVLADKIEVSKGWPWYYYASGAGVIVAGVAWLFMDKDDIVGTQIGFPKPPGTP